mmetsp:Transcript_26063/g.85741  ORF Transcript_26063/g.85741 Transcript_26063/m.85741 type:complete len:149 (-) Transcript_26063:78-524(-)
MTRRSESGEGTWEHVAYGDYVAALTKPALAVMTYADELGSQEAYRVAAELYDEALQRSEEFPDVNYKNAAIAFGKFRNRDSPCKMVHYFSVFLLKTSSKQEHQILRTLRDFLVHEQKMQEEGEGCSSEILLTAKKAYRHYRRVVAESK